MEHEKRETIYRRYGLTLDEAKTCVRCEDMAARLLDAGVSPSVINEHLLSYLSSPHSPRALGPVRMLRHAGPASQEGVDG